MLLQVVVLAAGLAVASATGCGGAVRVPPAPQNGIAIVSPNHPQAYPAFALCNWIINGSTPGPLYFHVNAFQTESTASGCLRGDYLKFSERVNGTIVQIGKILCGQDPVKQFQSKTNLVQAVFVSNHEGQFGGFHILVSSNAPCGGPVVIPSNGGVGARIILSPNYPSPYLPDSYCSWTVTSPQGSYISLQFFDAQLEDSSEVAPLDYVKITEEIDGSIVQIGRNFTGSFGNPLLRTKTNAVNVVFVSDGNNNHRGFRLQVYAEVPEKVIVIAGASTVFQSPHHPNNYPANSHQLYDITGPAGSKLQFDPEAFYTEIGHDYLELTEVVDGVTVPIGNWLSGNRLPRRILAQTNQVKAFFVSDSTGQYSGFKFTVSIQVPCVSSVVVPEFGIAAFTSPNFPRNYPNDVRCSYNITAPEGSQIYLTAIQFAVEETVQCVSDGLTFFETVDGEVKTLGERFCGNTGPNGLVSQTNNVQALFISNGVTEGLGFQIIASTGGFRR
ncbi:putative Cubilin [Hypsibius exemplaris]|uniref:Cubilin n=1 Tax=Hypsibius exemplaris TaxID=2072580 RepID=A0A1W0XFN1_HYPEX|nr:putative Cubilin [Hypsibius exemplaris]